MDITAVSMLFDKVGANQFWVEKRNSLGFSKIKILLLLSFIHLS